MTVGFFEYLAGNWGLVVQTTLAHAALVLISLGLAAVVGIPVAVAVYRTELPRTVALGVTGVFLTIPSYALFALFIPVLGLGNQPSVVALTMYALLPIVRNAVVGLRSVDPAIAESARGMGMGHWRRLRRVDLPLAWPVIVTGLRVATQILLGIAAIAAAVNGPGLGNLILDGLATAGTPFALYLTLEGILGIVVLAIVFDLLFVVFNRFTTSRGIRV